MGFRRMACVALSALMIAGVTAGCGRAANNSASDNASESNAPVTLTRWVGTQRNSWDIDFDKRFQAKYPNVKFNDVIQTDSNPDHVAAFAAGNCPNFCTTNTTMMVKYVYAGIALPLDSYLKNWPEAKTLNKQLLDQFQANFKHYAIVTNGSILELYYNKKLFKDAGIAAAPTTWDEMLQDSKKLTVPDKQQWGYNLYISDIPEWHFQQFVWAGGGDLTKKNADGTIKVTFTDPAVISAAKYYRSLVDNKCVESDMTMKSGDFSKAFATGHAAMTICGSGSESGFQQQGMNVDDIGIAPIPKGPNGKFITHLSGACEFISANCSKAQAQAAWNYIAYGLDKTQMETTFKQEADKGLKNQVMVLGRSGIDLSMFTPDPVEQKLVTENASTARVAFYGKAILTPYLQKAVQQSVLNPGTDIKTVFQQQQDLAQKEVVDKYNAQIKASNKTSSGSSSGK